MVCFPYSALTTSPSFQPGKKRLLLHSLLDPSKDEDDAQDTEPQRKKFKKNVPSQAQKIDLKGKRKNLPVCTRMKLEREQQSVIEMYRNMKKSKNQGA